LHQLLVRPVCVAQVGIARRRCGKSGPHTFEDHGLAAVRVVREACSSRGGLILTAIRRRVLVGFEQFLVCPIESSLSQLRLSAFNEFFTFDNTERSVFALLLVPLVFGNHLIPALTPFSRICLELISAVEQRHSALAEKRYTREQGL
jgi:hypothetical protein